MWRRERLERLEASGCLLKSLTGSRREVQCALAGFDDGPGHEGRNVVVSRS